MDSDQQTLCLVAATLTAASLGQASGPVVSGGNTAAGVVLRYRQVLAELAKGGGLLRAAG
jgi:hypothetical protein